MDFATSLYQPVASPNFLLVQDHTDEITCVAFNWNDCFVASGSLSGEIIVHNLTQNLSGPPFGHGSSQVKYWWHCFQ